MNELIYCSRCGNKNTLGFIKLLKNGKTLLYAPDQDYGMKNSNEVKFFNLPAATISAPLKIVQNTNCKTFFLNSYIKNNVLILDQLNFDNYQKRNLILLNHLYSKILFEVFLNLYSFL